MRLIDADSAIQFIKDITDESERDGTLFSPNWLIEFLEGRSTVDEKEEESAMWYTIPSLGGDYYSCSRCYAMSGKRSIRCYRCGRVMTNWCN